MTPQYIDIHSHVNFNTYAQDRDEVIKRALDSNTIVINVGTQIDTSRKAAEMTHEYPESVYAIVGLHPIHTGASYHDTKELGEGGSEFTSRGEIFDKEKYRELLKDPKVVGIGECGLDYYRTGPESIEKQKTALIAQIELANEVQKPLMLHIRNNPEDKSRNAYFDALELLKKYYQVKNADGTFRGDVHFFAGGAEEAKAFLDYGFCLSFTGVLTFTRDYDEIIKLTPLDRIMTETDAPYLTPVPYRGKRNEPSYVGEITKRIAEIKEISVEEVAQAVLANARRVFSLK